MSLHVVRGGGRKAALASDALPLPVRFTNAVFMVTFFSVTYYLMGRWRAKIRDSVPLHILSMPEIWALIAYFASFVYLIGFFGIDYVQGFISRGSDEDQQHDHRGASVEEEHGDSGDRKQKQQQQQQIAAAPPQSARAPALLDGKPLLDNPDDDIAAAVGCGSIASYSLERELKDAFRAARIRHRSVEIASGRSLEGLPVSNFNYDAVLDQCCEMVVGYVQIPVGVAGPLKLDGCEYTVPMATTEGCLVASTNRGCKAINLSGGATSVITKDGITRAPLVTFPSIATAASLKFYVDDPANFDTLSTVFNRQSRFARLRDVECTLAGRSVHIRFRCSTGDAMGMNMISKGAQSVLDYLQDVFPDMHVDGLSGNLCADKKATAVNWIKGRGKSVVCEAVIKGEVVRKVLKTSVAALVELNTRKNHIGSAMAGAVGGFNAHAANIVSAIFIATGQDPAQNVESSQCITIVEPVNRGNDLHVSVTMPSIEVGTIGGGTQLASQAACLNLLGVRGPHPTTPGLNAQRLSRVVAAAVLAGELSLLAALSQGQLVSSHLRYNRSVRNIAAAAASAEEKEKHDRQQQQQEQQESTAPAAAATAMNSSSDRSSGSNDNKVHSSSGSNSGSSPGDRHADDCSGTACF